MGAHSRGVRPRVVRGEWPVQITTCNGRLSKWSRNGAPRPHRGLFLLPFAQGAYANGPIFAQTRDFGPDFDGPPRTPRKWQRCAARSRPGVASFK
eukprot:6925500-Pyramimonas_sp.AAC.1